MNEDPRLGQVVAGCRLDAVLGRGGMGVVYLAEQLHLERRVALKLIASEYAQDAAYRERFVRESRLAAAIDHPNVVPVYEAGEADGLLYLIMRYVEGSDLRALMQRDGPFAPARTVGLIRQMAAALDAAHARGLVHRDVKPANVIVVNEDGAERAYLVDFGLAKRVESGAGPTAGMVGTVDYMAPEQIQGQRVDARTDIYSLGCVLYQLLTGAVPFPRETDVATLFAHLSDPPPRPTVLQPGCPAGIDGVIERALAKDPAQRFPSARDLDHAARAATVGAPVVEPERSVAVGAAAPAPAGVPPPPPPTRAAAPPPPPTRAAATIAEGGPGDGSGRSRTGRRLRRRITVFVAILVAGAIAGAAAALVLSQSGKKSAAQGQPPGQTTPSHTTSGTGTTSTTPPPPVTPQRLIDLQRTDRDGTSSSAMPATVGGQTLADALRIDLDNTNGETDVDLGGSFSTFDAKVGMFVDAAGVTAPPMGIELLLDRSSTPVLSRQVGQTNPPFNQTIQLNHAHTLRIVVSKSGGALGQAVVAGEVKP